MLLAAHVVAVALTSTTAAATATRVAWTVVASTIRSTWTVTRTAVAATASTVLSVTKVVGVTSLSLLHFFLRQSRYDLFVQFQFDLFHDSNI